MLVNNFALTEKYLITKFDCNTIDTTIELFDLKWPKKMHIKPQSEKKSKRKMKKNPSKRTSKAEDKG